MPRSADGGALPLFLGRRWTALIRPAYWTALALFAAWIVSRSWMRWIDPQIDFGVQLYIPWRITEGDHLGRDFVHPYGPLSSYFNAALFRVFGVSIRTLVIANLAIYAAIVGLLHTILRRAFGFFPASVATFVGVAIFGFGHYTGVNNYTFAAPYSHEATHGIALLLVLVLRQSIRERMWRTYVLDGVVFGLICLTKVEIVFTGVMILGVAALRRPNWRGIGVGALAASAVVGAAWALLASVVSGREAFVAATGGFLGPWLYSSYATSSTIISYIGLNRPAENLAAIVRWGLEGSAAVGLLTLGAVLIERLPRRVAWWAWAGGAVAAAAVTSFYVRRPPYQIAWANPALMTLGAACLVFRARREHARGRAVSARTWNMIFCYTAAAAMMARMALAPKIIHFGFVQAMLSVTWLSALFVGEWPRLIVQHWAGRRFYSAIAATVGCTVALAFTRVSLINYAAKTLPMGRGADRIMGFGLQVFVAHDNLEAARAFLEPRLERNAQLLVAPEGIMLNYWLRAKTPLHITNLLPATMELNRHDVLADLERNPPDYVVVATRTVADEGVAAFGSDEASGRRILQWLRENYLQEAHAGQDPLRPFSENKFGLWILKRRRVNAAG